MDSIFEEFYNQSSFIIIKDDNNNPWFLMQSVKEALNYNTRIIDIINNLKINKNNIKPFSDFEISKKKSKHQLRKNTPFINLAGLFKIIMSSRKKNISKFIDWISEDLLPKILIDGFYKLNKDTHTNINEKINNIVGEYEERFKSIHVENNKLIQKTLMLETENLKLKKILTKKEKSKPYLIYILQFDDLTNRPLYKVGFTRNLKKRIPTYKTGKADKPTVVFQKDVSNGKLIEETILYSVRNYLYLENNELVDIELKYLLNIINKTIDNIETSHIITNDNKQIHTII
jgi:prophage antirepressor-like protein